MPTLALLDGHSLAYRAFYALPSDLATSAGQVTNAVFGFTSMLIKLLGDERPDAVAVAWDVRGPNFRKEMYEDYKAQRERPPDLFAAQLPLIDDVLRALKITQLRAPGYEADDVIATLAGEAGGAGWDVVVVTGDRDAFQLVDDQVKVLYTWRGVSESVIADADWIEGRYGVRPDQYLDYASFRGDNSDNLPGVPKVGEKTAAKLINSYGSVEGVYEHLDEQTPKLKENLEAFHGQVLLNRKLMALVRDVPVKGVDGEPVEPGDFLLEAWDHDEVREVFDSLAFRTLWERLLELGGQAPVQAEVFDIDVRSAVAPGELPDGTEPLAVEVVWDGPELAGLVVATDGDDVAFVPAAKLDAVGSVLRERRIVAHDAKPIVRLLIELGLEPPPVAFDTALAAYLVNPAQRTPDLPDLAQRELGLAVTDDGGEQAAATEQGAFNFDDEPGPDVDAAGRRAVAVTRLVQPMRAQLHARGGAELFEDIELPLVTILAQMEVTGIGVDRAFLEQLSEDLHKRLGALESEIHAAAGGPFNVNSTLQLREILFDRLGLPVLKKTPKGAPSTDATVLAKLRDAHPLVDALLQFRELEKLRSTYVDAMLPLIEADGRVRGRFNQMAAATGRLSQEQPNLQNIPVRSEEGRTIRKAFVADEGARFLVADYSQIELRILAHLSGDPGLVDAFRTNLDIHTATAARVNGVDPDDVTSDQRRRAKMVNFGLLYGMEAYGLAQRLEISRDEAQAQIDAYFAQFPDVRQFMQGIVDEARSTGYTTTLLGRRRYLPELASRNFRDRQAGERMALNAPIQGSAADIIKKAMVVLEAELRSAGHTAEMLLQIHDELVLEVPDEELARVTELTTEIMEGIVELRVPLRVDVATGANLGECKN
ncbi:MAG TPA: DNA polymerase I [Acidimicrobiia bacterium]|jgi:DNA polymerase-1|nr:DNA polymerase I [Acidimicrobiia bacterium]